MKGLHRIFVLPAEQVEALAARHYQLKIRARRKQFSDLAGRRQDLLKVVKDD